MWMSQGGSAITTANFPRMDTSKYLISQQIHCRGNTHPSPFPSPGCPAPAPPRSPSHLRGKQLPHVAVAVACPQSELRGPSLGPQQAALGLGGAVDLIVDILAGVHVEASVEEGAVAQTLICVFVDDATAR